MKRLLALVLLLLPTSASAFAGYQPFSLTPSESTNVHIMVVRLDSLEDANDNAARVDEAVIFGNLLEVLRAQGAEIHTYTYSWFKNQYGSKLWRDAGLQRSAGGGGYAVALLPYWSSSSTSGHGKSACAFFRGDSTSTHIIHYGKGTTHNISDDDNAGAQVGPACRSTWDAVSLSGLGGYGVRVNSNTADTCFFDRMPLAFKATSGIPTGTSKVVSLFRGASQTDSVIANGDTLFAGWRVYCTNQGNAQQATPYADFVVGADGTEGLTTLQGDLVYALASKWLKLQPIKIAMSWNDYAEFGMNPRYLNTRSTAYGTSFPASVSNWAWPRASQLDSIISDLGTTYGVKSLVVGTSGDSAAWLWSNYTAYATAKGWPVRWGPHWHSAADSTSWGTTPFGRGVSNWDTSNASTTSRRVGNRFNPGNATVALRFGVAQRIAEGDSAFRANRVAVSPFMLPGNDALMPVGWNDYSSSTVCPAESLFNALGSQGKTYIANFTANGADLLAGTSVVRLTTSNTNARWPIFPDEIYRTTTGTTIRFMGYDVMSSSGGAPNNPNTGGPLDLLTLTAPQQITNELFGILSFRYGNTQPRVLVGGTSAAAAHCAGIGRIRVYGWHVNFVGNVPHGWYSDYYILTRMLKRIKALQDIAGGKPLVQWVYPEAVYD